MGRGKQVVLDDQGRKKCPKCDEYKPLSAYSPQPGKSLLVNAWCKECVAKSVHASYDFVKMKDRQLRHTYGLTSEEYEKMLSDQHGVCACCGKPELRPAGRSKRTIDRVPMLHVDHCHTTGAIRGLLCSSCNQALGLLNEDPERVKALLKYIEERVLW